MRWPQLPGARLITLLGVVVAGFFAIWLMVLQFQYPELTDTQRFLQYWPQQLGALVGAVVALVGWMSR